MQWRWSKDNPGFLPNSVSPLQVISFFLFTGWIEICPKYSGRVSSVTLNMEEWVLAPWAPSACFLLTKKKKKSEHRHSFCDPIPPPFVHYQILLWSLLSELDCLHRGTSIIKHHHPRKNKSHLSFELVCKVYGQGELRRQQTTTRAKQSRYQWLRKWHWLSPTRRRKGLG